MPLLSDVSFSAFGALSRRYVAKHWMTPSANAALRMPPPERHRAAVLSALRER